MLRFRLKTLLTFITVLALCGVIATMSLQRQRDRATLERLRSEAGALDVVDPDLICIRHVETHNPYFWKWRIYAPPNTQLDYGVEIDGKFHNGHKPSRRVNPRSVDSNPDGVVLTVAVSPLINGVTTVTVRLDNSNVYTLGTNLTPDDWLPTPNNCEIAGLAKTETFAYDNPIHFVRRRTLGTSSDQFHPLGGTPVGLDVWAVPRRLP